MTTQICCIYSVIKQISTVSLDQHWKIMPHSCAMLPWYQVIICILLYLDLNYAIVIGPTRVTWCAKINSVARLYHVNGSKMMSCWPVDKDAICIWRRICGCLKCTSVTNFIILGLGLGNRVKVRVSFRVSITGLFVTAPWQAAPSSDWPAAGIPAAGRLFTTLFLTARETFRDVTKQILTASLDHHWQIMPLSCSVLSSAPVNICVLATSDDVLSFERTV